MPGVMRLFTLVGIAGEDDLDAPDLIVASSAGTTKPVARQEIKKTASTAAQGNQDHNDWQAVSAQRPLSLPPGQCLSLKHRLLCATN